MNSYKVVEILRTFTNEDIKRFRDFLNSPFFNKSTKLVKFYEALIVFHPGFDSKFLNEKRLLKKVNPELPFNKSTMLNLFSDLAESAEKYFVQTCLQRSVVDSLDFLRDELFRRKLNKNIEAKIKKSDLILKEMKNMNSIYFINLFKLSNDMINIQMINKNKSKSLSIKLLSEMHSQRGKYITCFFVKEMIRGFDNLMVLDKTFRIEKEDNFIFKVFKTVEFGKLLRLLVSDSNNKTCSKIFEMYLSMHLAFTEFEKEKHYYNYKKLIINNLKYFGDDEIRFHCIGLIRYCMLKSSENNKAEKFNKELFDVYNFILQNEYYKLSLTEYIPVELYRTILLLSLQLNKYKWAQEFIKKYKSKLPPDKRVNIYHYSCAEYYFSRGRYAEAMKSFHKVKLDHFMLKLDVKNLMLMTYYELGLFENALSCIDAYKHFLSNDKTLSHSEKQKDKNFISVVDLMIKYHLSYNPDCKFKIEKELKKVIPFRGWVEEKVSQMDVKYVKSA